MNVAEFIYSIVQKLGTDTAFCLTGGMAMHINRAMAESSMQVIYCNHEQAVVAAADGYAKAKEFKVPGLAVVTSGPGVMNLYWRDRSKRLISTYSVFAAVAHRKHRILRLCRRSRNARFGIYPIRFLTMRWP